jgi:transcription-repair coupling factor (superfamily II helicase)
MANSILGLYSGTEGLLLSQISQGKSLLFICKDNEEIKRISQLITFFDSTKEALEFPEWDCLPYDRISPSTSISHQRLKCLSKLVNSKHPIIITTAMGLTQYLPPKSVVTNSSLHIHVKQDLNPKSILEFLISHGYVRSINAVDSGEFAARGSIVDIVPSEEKFGYRLDFFGSNLESIRTYDTDSQKSIAHVSSISLLPSSEIVLTKDVIETFRDRYQALFGVSQDLLYESIMAGRKFIGMEHWLSLFYQETPSFFDYLPANTTILLPYDFEAQLEENYKFIESQYSLRSNTKLHKNDGVYNVLETNNLYLTQDQLVQKLDSIHQSFYSPFNYDSSQIQNVEYLYQTAKAKEISTFSLLQKSLNSLPILIACFTSASVERLANILADHDLTSYKLDTWPPKSKNVTSIGLFVAPIEHGFQTQEFIIYSEQDILGQRLSRKSSSSSNTTPTQLISALSNLYAGDLIVHKEHGIGKFEKLEQIKVGSSIHDFVKILYAEDAKYYLPVENLELISRYGTEHAPLDKLGSLGWQTRKAKLKNRIKIAAEKLLKIAAERNLVKTPAIIANDDIYSKFCEAFPYVETDDQLKAIDDITNDFAAEKPIDRLVCGDVGFGKTEVALRAVCQILASEHPSQVAILVPTTLLARQHFKTLSERFSGLPYRIAQLSKFTPPKDVKRIKADIADGKVDVVVGTHMLLAKDIKFANLGLLVIDEEQHFGVGQKEKLKELKSSCHILTLSATPIPRTLQMSLFGIKDLSIIATPPVDRMPIKTYVIPYDSVTLREAILREHYRGGRTFYITPRVAYLDGILDTIKALVPEIKAVKAHGQMTAEQLDSIMNDFYDGKYDVLVSTNIIESGLDVPQANTMIVDRADMYGLSQLYQIRGRIGRSNIQAYAYLTLPPNKRLSDNAEKRLSVISSFETLGAGFSIASHDMDIRGYGNLVGEEQSGHVKEVGVELYQAMLQEAIEDIQINDNLPKIDNDWSPAINLGLSIQIPESYISDSSLRLSLYRQIANIKSNEELDIFATDMIDRYGKIPVETVQLFKVVQLKHLAKSANIEKIDLGEKGVLISFRNNEPKSPEKVIELINKNPIALKLRGDQKIFYSTNTSEPEKLIQKLESIVKSIIAQDLL